MNRSYLAQSTSYRESKDIPNNMGMSLDETNKGKYFTSD